MRKIRSIPLGRRPAGGRSRAAAASAQVRDDRYPGVTGTIPPAAVASPAGGPAWSGESGASGDPRMTAAAIRAAAAEFRWLPRTPVAAGGPARHLARGPIAAYTAALTPDLRIMDLLDGQPEFTKSFWDYLDLLVNDTRIEQGRALLAATSHDLRCGGARLRR